MPASKYFSYVRKRIMGIRYFFVLITILFLPVVVCSQSIGNTVHNLSISGPGDIKSSSESEICIFCHTPHRASPRAPLWNREDPGVTYTPYSSNTLESVPGQPDGSSVLCLSCHDGTIALGSVLSETEPIEMENGVTVMPSGTANLGTNLSNHHPISFIYDASLAAADGELADPATLTGPVHLENDKLQCTACHDPHNDVNGNFLTVSNQNSELCQYCHQKGGWASASHKTSTALVNTSSDHSLLKTEYRTVGENGCENCHLSHSGTEQTQEMSSYRNEYNCLRCHNGNSSGKNIETDINKPWRHPVSPETGIHHSSNDMVTQAGNVECTDCHNPHKANSDKAEAPNASGAIQGVSGIDSKGNPVKNIQYQYELCFKCHSDNFNKPGTSITRQIEQTNVRLEFDPANPSYHPVEAIGQNRDVTSLISPLSESSLIYCTGCHSGSGPDAAAGPHGSSYAYLLKYNYETADYTPESYQAYELCYQCHDRDQIVNNTANEFSEKIHKKHIVEENTPCSVCHDAHGINFAQGNVSNNSHLINFNTAIVKASRNMDSRIEFIDNGILAGECTLYCHNKNHYHKKYD